MDKSPEVKNLDRWMIVVERLGPVMFNYALRISGNPAIFEGGLEG